MLLFSGIGFLNVMALPNTAKYNYDKKMIKCLIVEAVKLATFERKVDCLQNMSKFDYGTGLPKD